jgi:hypothetical protein
MVRQSMLVFLPMAFALTAGCSSSSPSSSGPGGGAGTGGRGGPGGFDASAADTGGGRSAVEGGPTGPVADGATAHPQDGAVEEEDAGSRLDAGSGADTSAAGPGDAADGTGGGGAATVNLTFAGCSPDFSGTIYVVYNNGTFAVDSLTASSITGAFELVLNGMLGPVTIDTANRESSGLVIDLVVDTTYTNVSSDTPDPISGTLTINADDPANGVVDLGFDEVVLQDPESGNLCTVNGTLVTTRLNP